MNPERLIDDAKALALSIAPGYVGGVPRTDVEVGGAHGGPKRNKAPRSYPGAILRPLEL